VHTANDKYLFFCHLAASPNFIGNNEAMTESCINAVISNLSYEGEKSVYLL